MIEARIVLLSLLSPLLASAFTIPLNQQSSSIVTCKSSRSTTTTFMTKIDETDAKLVITGNNIDLTGALQDYTEKRIGGLLEKLGNGIVNECDVHLSVCKNPKVKDAHRVDCTTSLKGLTIHCKEESSDMYASIDAAAKALSSKLQKYRARRKQGWHSGNKMGNDLMEALEQMESDEIDDAVAAEVSREEAEKAMSKAGDFIDSNEPNIMKVNSYDLESPIPIKEAVFALDYVDHDFFVFKDEETGKPSIVYKRNAGGIGLIEIP